MAIQAALTSAQRATIFSMARGMDAIAQTQSHLDTGKKVNSSADDALAYFTAIGLNNNADDYSKVKDKLALASKAVKTGLDGLEAIKKLVDQMQGILTSVSQTTDATTRTNLRTTYNALLKQVTTLAQDASLNGKNLILASTATDHLEVVFDPEAGSKLTVLATTNTATGLGFASYTTWGASNTYLTTATNLVSSALSTLKVRIQSLGVNLATITTRDEWTQTHVDNLRTSSDSLTLADINEEAANLKALQMTQFFGMSNLGFTNQMQQGILRLLG